MEAFLNKNHFTVTTKQKAQRKWKKREGMAVWYGNSRTAPWLWHRFQMACQICCRAQISARPWSSNITCVTARTLWPVGKYTVRADCMVISTTHRVISALRSTGTIKLLTLCAQPVGFPLLYCKTTISCSNNSILTTLTKLILWG